jgi:hypothetical protein
VKARWAQAALAALMLVLAGCGSEGLGPSIVPCSDDSQCPSGQLCFPEGCGDPGKGIVVEVTANSRSGLHAQDFAITTLTVTQNIEIFPAMSVVGDIAQRASSAQNADATLPYKAQVNVRAVGESALIPGLGRSYEATFASLDHGAYSMFIGAGNYTVTATALDTSVPPDARPGLVVVPGTGANQSFLFQDSYTAVPVSALLVKTAADLVGGSVTFLTAKMEVQAFDPATHRALSQRTPVTKDDGAFTLWMDPLVGKLDAFQIVATPADSAVVAPSKTFTLTRPLPAELVLEMGAFGQSLPGITGTIRDAADQPVAGATVIIDGMVGGGGTYRTRAVTTDEAGLFKVEAFLSPAEGPFNLTAIPPPSSPAGIFKGTVKVSSKSVAGFLDKDVFRCPSRVQLMGSLVRPDGTPAPGAKVTAVPIASVDGNTLPVDPVDGRTDDSGRFSLMLDPAEYRLDFFPGEGLPRRSRFVTVRSVPSRSAGPTPIELTEYRLARGRTVTGTISSQQQAITTASTKVPNASLRFFRVTSVAGKRSSILLAESIADEFGFYQAVLPQSATPAATSSAPAPQ